MYRFITLISLIILSTKAYSAIIYVNVNASGANNGTSWANAYTDLQSALSIAFINDDIWVAAGTYKPTQTTSRTISFVMKNGVDVFGGFDGTETSISARNIAVNPTYLSGDIGAQGDNTDNTYKVVKIQNFTAPFTLDGFRIVSGRDGTASGKGAGIYVENNPGILITIKNTILYNNYAYHSGGGMLIDNSNTTFNNCEFLYNSSYNYGGGAIYSANVSNSNIYLYDCKFIGNNSRQGVVINFGGNELIMERNFISSNTNTDSGDIIHIDNGVTRFEMNNSLITGNQLADAGSSVISSNTDGANSSSLTNVTICHNKNSSSLAPYSEAIYQSNSAMVISNCIVFGNTNSDLNTQIDAGNTVRNSIIENGYSTGVNINTANPLFVNPGTLSLAPFDASTYDYSLQNGSPAINYGNNTYAQIFTLDFLNNTRIQQVIVDCGAIESPFTDTQDPVASCSDITLPLNADGLALLSDVQINNNSSDNIGITSYTLSQTTFDCTQIGTNPVLLTVTDAAGNSSSCTSTVTVVDLITPTVLTQNFSVYLDETGHATISVSDIDNGTADNCGLDTIYITPSTFTCANSGSNVVTFTAADVNGNTVSVNVTVTVIDSVFPVAQAQDMTVYLNSNGLATLSASQVNNGSYDDCSIASMTLSKTNYNCTDLGVNQVTFGVSDEFNNLSTVPVSVSVLDTIKPVTIGQSITVNLNISNPAVITASQINNGSSDNCTFAQSVAPASFTAIGTYSVVLTSTDLSGNSSSATYTVQVVDESVAAIDEQDAWPFKVFPNPTEGLIHVKINAPESQIALRLLDVSGKLISMKQFFNTNEFDFIIEETTGLYLLEIETPTLKSRQIKVVKN
jgi:hypothetical protein